MVPDVFGAWISIGCGRFPLGKAPLSGRRRDVEFEADEGFEIGRVYAGEAQAEERGVAFEVKVKIEKGAALAFGGDPGGKFGERGIRRAELEFLTLFRFDDLLAHGNEFFREL